MWGGRFCTGSCATWRMRHTGTVEYDAMSTSDENDAGDAPEGVFGNLPTTRPGARSPRREAEAAPEQPAEPPPAPAPEQAVPPPHEPPPAPEPAPQAEPDEGGGIEEVAWAGVAAAAEAATIGVRLATRALEAVRDAVDRR
jgi:hypothetical protein